MYQRRFYVRQFLKRKGSLIRFHLTLPCFWMVSILRYVTIFDQYNNMWCHHLAIGSKCPYQHPMHTYEYRATIGRDASIKYVVGYCI